MTTISIPLLRRRMPIGTVVLAALFLLGILAALFRWVDGFERVSSLSDSRPWGIWISFDLLVGVAISSGAFLLAATVHIFRIEKYRPILRPALLTGFLGYLLEILALLVDMGQPQRIWHMIIYQNLGSSLFTVGMCVMIYTLVLLLEFSPAVLEKLKWHSLNKVVEKISIPTVVLGVAVSIVHQASLGSLFLIVPYKMHPLWYTALLPLIFLVSAIAVGFGMVIFESVFSSWVYGEEPHLDIVRGLSRGLLVSLIVLFTIKIFDLILAGEIGLIFEGSLQSAIFILETLVGILLPAGILLIRKTRDDLTWIFRASLLSVLGLILNRLNIGLVSMAGEPYVPHILEVAVTVGLFAGGILIFGLAKKYLPLEGTE
jgi:Ni/Fe-hydrogenase subunit HybB-like protein